MAGPRILPDQQLAANGRTDDALANVELAEALGLPRERVWAVRRRIQRAGHWTCPLIWSLCMISAKAGGERAKAAGPDIVSTLGDSCVQ